MLFALKNFMCSQKEAPPFSFRERGKKKSQSLLPLAASLGNQRQVKEQSPVCPETGVEQVGQQELQQELVYSEQSVGKQEMNSRRRTNFYFSSLPMSPSWHNLESRDLSHQIRLPLK